MKITEVRVHPLSGKTARTWTAHEPMVGETFVLFEVRTDDGLVGYGEVQGGPQKTICDLALQMGEAIAGMDALGHAEVWSRLFSITVPRPGGLGGWDGLPPPLPRGQRAQFMAALGGIDIALWDIKGKAAGLPLFRLLGGSRTSVLTYSTGGYYTEGAPLDAVVEEFAGFVAMGYKAVKSKTGALSIADEAERCRLIREAIGPDTLFMLDMNAPFDVDGCIEFANAVAPHGITWLEEPLFWHLQPQDYVRLAAASPIPLAHGEREWHRYTVRDFIDSGAIKYVQFDSTRFAGLTESLRIAHYAEQKGVTIAPHSAPHYHAHLASAFGDAAFAAESHGDHDRHPVRHAIYSGGAHFQSDGMVHLTEEPGFGFDIDWKAVDRFRV